MLVSILSILAYLVPFILDAWQASSPERAKEAANAAIQNGRNDVYKGDVAMVDIRIDRLLHDVSVPEQTAVTDSTARQYSDPRTAERLFNLLNS